MNRSSWWVDSGQAVEAAMSLVWFVILVFVVLGVVIYLDIKKEKKDDRDQKR